MRRVRSGVIAATAAVVLAATAGAAGLAMTGADRARSSGRAPAAAERAGTYAATVAPPMTYGGTTPPMTYGGTTPPADRLTTPPLPLTTDDYGDPNAVVLRRPDRDYGSGYHGDYGIYRRQTSPAEDLRTAAASANGCLIVGDSIATFVQQALSTDLRQTEGDTCVYDTWPGRATEGTANAVLDIKRRVGLPPRVIVMSGTNDIFNPPLFETQMNRVIDGIGPGHEILWVSTFDSRRPASAASQADERNTAWINEVLAARAARTPNMHIVRWDSLFRGDARNVEALLSDGVHPNEAGIDAMVGLVRASLSVAR